VPQIAKIALEEHFLIPGFEDYWRTTVENVDPGILGKLTARLCDFDGVRLEDMDRAGVQHAVLSLSGPGVQIERDAATAVRRAREANDVLAGHVSRNRSRYSGFAHLPMQDPAAAADELERCVKVLGFAGCMINGHTHGVYLDDPSLHVFWERAEALGVIVYLHPADPVEPLAVLKGHAGLRRATWEWGVETGSHALRIVFSGLFDRYPRARLALGHLGETLPYLLWRFDSRARLYAVKLGRAPSDYIRDNIVVTMSGMYSAEPLRCAIDALGARNVMFSADYPFESIDEAGRFMDEAAMPDDVRAEIAFNNANRVLALGLSPNVS
jgi:2,3-dihydroxybenzoate decarboxylase